jgi:glycosyltransferase involved in cell wall biosynthesis
MVRLSLGACINERFLMSDPLVSIVIPAHNPAFFSAALHSALIQTYANLEVIVCDDSRTDEIRHQVDRFAGATHVVLRYVSNAETTGMPANVLRAVSEARGEYLKILCDDDQLYPSCVQVQVQAFIEHPEASLALAPRGLCDAQGAGLPGRVENITLAYRSGLLKGSDLLALLQDYPLDFLGNFSSAVFRRADVVEFLPALTQPGHCFTAVLDLALFVCVLNKGNLLYVNQLLSVERLHAARLRNHREIHDAVGVEKEWLVQMLRARTAEPPPAKGWVRLVGLEQAGQQPRIWEELPLNQAIGNLQRSLPEQVGASSQDFSELYQEWLACRQLTPAQLRLMPDIVARWPVQPRIVPVVVDREGHGPALQATLSHIEAQHYPGSLVVVLSAECHEPQLTGNIFRLPLQKSVWTQINGLIDQLEGADWIYLLRAGDQPVKAAFLVLADRIAHCPDGRCVYSDEGGLSDGKSSEPVLKPDFNLDLLRSYPYVGRTLAFERQSVRALGGFDLRFAELAPIDLLWRTLEQHGEQAVMHIPEVLVESDFAYGQWLASREVNEQNSLVVAAHLDRSGVAHCFDPNNRWSSNKIRYLHTHQPLVSIAVVNQDQLSVLQRCVESIFAHTAYADFELVLVDNGSVHAASREWMEAMTQIAGDKLRVVSCASSATSVALNLAVEHARGDYVVLASPYLVATEPQWLDELMHQAMRPEVAVVGPLLFDSRHTVSHAGLILGLRASVGSPFAGQDLDTPGYMGRLDVVQDLSAVGGDCMLFRKQAFKEAGGFDPQRFPEAGYDVDLCLRIQALGYLIVWTPFSRLAIGKKAEDGQAYERAVKLTAALYDRWLPKIANDPAYNPNLALDSSGYSLNPGPRSGWTPFTQRNLPNVLAVPINASASGHYRVVQPLLELEGVGRAVGRISHAKPGAIDIERQRPDVVILQGRYSETSTQDILNIRRYSRARLIYELDDYPLDVPAKNGHVRKRLENMENILRQSIGACDRVVVSTQPLADAFASMHADIRVVPNMLAPHLWNGLRSQRGTSRKPRVGWGGGTSHTGDLELIADVVKSLADEVDWIFFGMCPDALRPYIAEFHSLVNMDAYPQKLASLNLDLALAPLESHFFNDCKSNLRLLEYGACGYPVICSDALAYRGYLPCTRVISNSTEEWIAAICRHLEDRLASYKMGDALREMVLRDYMLRGENLQNWANAWLGD